MEEPAYISNCAKSLRNGLNRINLPPVMGK